MRLMNNNWRVVPLLAMVALMGPFDQAQVRADELVDLQVDSKPRKYDVKNPVQAEKQDFSLSKPGIVTYIHIIEPAHKDARGGASIDEVNLSNYQIGKGIFLERIPDTAIPGQKYTFKQQWLCGPRKEPLNLRATLVAPYRPNDGAQLGASQSMKIDFVPFQKISAEAGPKPEVDVSGKWYHGEANAIWTLTPKGDGEYDAVEKGYDNSKGTARVKGRKVYIDWETTTAKDGKQSRGVTVVEIKPDGTHAEGWTVGENGTGGNKWSAVPGTTAKPVGPAVVSPAGTAGRDSPPSSHAGPSVESLTPAMAEGMSSIE